MEIDPKFGASIGELQSSRPNDKQALHSSLFPCENEPTNHHRIGLAHIAPKNIKHR